MTQQDTKAKLDSLFKCIDVATGHVSFDLQDIADLIESEKSVALEQGRTEEKERWNVALLKVGLKDQNGDVISWIDVADSLLHPHQNNGGDSTEN